MLQTFSRLKDHFIIQASSNHQLFDKMFVKSWFRVALCLFGVFWLLSSTMFSSFFFANPEGFVHLMMRRNYEKAVLCPFPWCEDELHFHQVTDFK